VWKYSTSAVAVWRRDSAARKTSRNCAGATVTAIFAVGRQKNQPESYRSFFCGDAVKNDNLLTRATELLPVL
jgi:hypothetical protein